MAGPTRAGMRIEAVRLREVGVFRTARQLTHFGPGLNVFAGANELGKSTVFRALRALFEEPYTANNKTVRELRSDHGGAPLIEADFETGGQRWRLTKQFLAGKAAELKRIDAETIYRGGDVETALDDILVGAFGNRAAMHLLWVAQGDSFVPPVPSTEMRQTLEQLVQAEAEAAGGGAELAYLLKSVRKNLFELVTEKARRPKTGGAYAAAISACDELRNLHREAQEKVEASAQRRKRIAEIEQSLATLSDPKRRALLDERIGNIGKALDDARQARIKADLAAERVKTLTVRRASTVQGLERFNSLAAEHADIETRRVALVGEQDSVVAKIAAAEAEQKQAEHDYKELLRRRDELQARKLNAQRLAHRHSLVEHQLTLQQRLDRAREVLAEHKQTSGQHDSIGIVEGALQQLETLHSDFAATAAQIAATAATVSIAYEPGHQTSVHLDGEPLRDDAMLRVDRAMTLSIPGVGTINLQPPSEVGGEQPGDRLTMLREQIAELQSQAGVEGIEQARAAMRTKRELKAQLDAQKASLQSIAPDGVEALEKERDATADKIADFGEVDEVDLDRLTADGDELDEQLRDGEQRVRSAAKALASLREHHAGRTSELTALADRHGAIATDLPGSPEALMARRTELEQMVAEATDALNAATRDLAAWSDAAPEVDAVNDMAAKLSGLEVDRTTEQRQIADLREELRGLEGALARDLEDGVEVEARDLAERLGFAEERLADIAQDVAALTLLEGELGIERERQSSLTVGPISDRLSQLARHVLPEGRFQLGQDLAVAGLQREGRDEAELQLSGGTREQISVLARLAYAGLLAENGFSAPLLLDDALVFSDDQRLDQVFEVLAEAAQHHQIVILTCHARSFAPLVARHGANELQLSSWQ